LSAAASSTVWTAVIPMVTENAYQTGGHSFVVDPYDDMTPGFVLR
jgi:proline racemase